MEILNENPKIIYEEEDYQGLHGLKIETEDEIKLIFNKNASDKIKELFKKYAVQNILYPKEYLY